MFQRFAPKAANREADYKFCDIREFESQSDEEKSTPEKIILKELNIRQLNSPIPRGGRLKLSPLADSKPTMAFQQPSPETPKQGDFVLEFKAEDPVKERADDSHTNHVRFEVYDDVQTPMKNAKESVLVSPDVRFKSAREDKAVPEHKPAVREPVSENSFLVSPDMRFKSGRGKKLAETEKDVRSPLAPVNRNSSRMQDMAFEVEEIEEDFDVEQLFSRIRHNRVQNVVDALEGGCDPFLVDGNGNSMLHVCAQNNLKKLSNICIKHGCDLNARNKKGMTPLDYCDMLKFNALAEWMVVMGAENGAAQVNRVPPVNSFHTTRGMR